MGCCLLTKFMFMYLYKLGCNKQSLWNGMQSTIFLFHIYCMNLFVLCFGDFYRQRLRKFDKRCKRKCRKIVKSQAFYWLIIVLVFLNTVILSTEHYGQPDFLDVLQGKIDVRNQKTYIAVSTCILHEMIKHSHVNIFRRSLQAGTCI